MDYSRLTVKRSAGGNRRNDKGFTVALKLKRDANGNVVVVGEKPVIINEDGTEQEFDIEHTIKSVKDRNASIVAMRDELKLLKDTAAKFEGLDPEAARNALVTLSKVDQKKLIDAGQVDEVVKTMKAEHEKAMSAVKGELDSVKSQYKSSQISAAFANSEFLKKRVEGTPVQLIQSYFEKNFGIGDDGGIVGLDGSGRPIYSTTNPSQVANFDEALERFIGASPFRDTIITTGQGSGGNTPSGGTGGNATGRMTRKQFDDLPESEKPAAATKFTIVD